MRLGAAVPAAALALLALGGAGAAAADPHSDYMLHCQGCHGPDGGGARGAVPSFRGGVARFLAVPGGREYLVRVPGTSQSELSDARVAALLNWLLREFSAAEMPADFVPYEEAEVSRLRRPPLTDVDGERRRLLAAMEEPRRH
jgi:mono/diheme cytochrome c family protein